MVNEDWTHQVAGAVVSAIACAAAYYIMPLSIFSPRLIAFVPLLLSFVCAYSGWLWAAIGAAGVLVCAYAGCDIVMAAAALVGLVLPVGVQYYVNRKQLPFERSIVINMTTFAALGVCALGILRIVKGDIADIKAAYVTKLWNDQLNLDLFNGGMLQTLRSREMLLNIFAVQGYLSRDLIMKLQANPTSELYGRAFEYIVYTLKSVTAYTATGNLASAAIFVGVVITSWPRMIFSRRWTARSVPFLSLEKWYMKSETALYSAGIYVLSTVMMLFMPRWWYSVDFAIKQCVVVIMSIQGVAAIERQLKRGGVRRGLRGGLLFCLTLFMRTFVTVIGVASALFGSHGAISTLIKEKMKNSDDDDD